MDCVRGLCSGQPPFRYSVPENHGCMPMLSTAALQSARSSMADHFALMTGRMITEATLQGAIFDAPSAKDACDHHDPSVFEDGRTKTGVVVECRICQEEGDQAYMETPCSCKGSLKARFSAPLPA